MYNNIFSQQTSRDSYSITLLLEIQVSINFMKGIDNILLNYMHIILAPAIIKEVYSDI